MFGFDIPRELFLELEALGTKSDPAGPERVDDLADLFFSDVGRTKNQEVIANRLSTSNGRYGLIHESHRPSPVAAGRRSFMKAPVV